MQQVVEQQRESFVDRRDHDDEYDGRERRQFADSREANDPGVRELAEAVDAYKIRHRRRFITFEELYEVIMSLGYSK